MNRGQVLHSIQAVLGRAGWRLQRLPDLGHGPRPKTLTEAHFEAVRVLPTRDHLLPLIPQGCRVAELGVLNGEFSRKILDVVKPRTFLAVDVFDLDKTMLGNSRTPEFLQGASHEDAYRRRFQQEVDAGIVEIRKGRSHEVLEEFPDGFFDVIYVDADHGYQSVKLDVEASRRKLSPDGWLAMDDYERSDPYLTCVYGVKHVAHELCHAENWRVVYLTLESAEGSSNVVLQRAARPRSAE